MSRPQLECPPSLEAGSLSGNFFDFRHRPIEFLSELANLGDVTYIQIFNQRTYFLNHPDLICDLLVTSHSKFVKGGAMERAPVLLGEGLLTSETQKHLRQRRMIQPAFHHNRIARYADQMTESAMAVSKGWKNGDIRRVDRDMMRLTLQIVGKTLFSAEVGKDAKEVGRAITELMKAFNYVVLSTAEISKRTIEPRKKLDQIIDRIINERRKSGIDNGDLLSMLLMARYDDDGQGINHKQVRDEALTIFIAGHETTANALTFMWYMLSQNPEKEANLHKELDSVLNGRTPSMEDIKKLKYTKNIFAESMRLFPPVWLLSRLSVEEHQFNSYRVPKGSTILISPYITQRDERFWDDPTEFIPERWDTLSVEEVEQEFVYFPFSRGVRGCIGENFAWMEGVLLIASLAKKWRLRPVKGQNIDLQPLLTLRFKNGIKMRLEERC